MAAFLSSATPEGSSALLTTPKSQALRLTPLEFRTILNIRLRANITDIPNLKCSCCKHTDIDNKGDHLSKCQKGPEIYATHDAVKFEIAAFCRSNGLFARVEPTNLFTIHDPNDNRRPDIEVLGLPKKLLLDTTIVSPLASDLNLAQAMIQGRAATNAVSRKNNYYRDACTAAGYGFIPLAMENRGLWSKEMKLFFNQVVKYGTQHNSVKLSILKCYWMRRISLTLLKYSAKLVLARLSRAQSPNHHDESHYLEILDSQSTNLSPIQL